MKHINEFVSIYDTAVTIGKFDGFHIGHMELFSRVKSYAASNGLKATAVSFKPHPAETLGIERGYKTIFTQDEKKQILEELGVDIYVEYPFTMEFAHTPPKTFAEEMLFKGLRCKYIVVGEGYRFGRNKNGTDILLEELAAKHGAYVDIVENVELDSHRISSSLVRRYIQDCDFENARRLMYKPFFVSGIVVHGKKIGRTIGVPTINITPGEKKLLPPDGVYATKVDFSCLSVNGVTNVGASPTISEVEGRTVETHLLDWDKSIYGEHIKVTFIKRLRDVIKFESMLQLREQIDMDIIRAKKVYNA